MSVTPCKQCLEEERALQSRAEQSGHGSGTGSVHGSKDGSRQSQRSSTMANTQQDGDRPNPSDPRYVIIRMSNTKLLECRNTLNSNMSVFKQYGGRILGFGHSLKCLETEMGKWDPNVSILVLWFPDATHVELWWDCMPVVKQHDWLHGVDIVVVPARPGATAAPPAGKGCMMFSDIDFHDPTDRPDYTGVECDKMRAKGIILGLTATRHVTNKRGCWDPKFLTINYFPCEHALRNFYDADAYVEAKQARQARSISDVVYFDLQPM